MFLKKDIRKIRDTSQNSEERINTGSVPVLSHYSLSGQLIAESDNSGAITAEYIYLNSQPLAKIEGTNVYYYHNDYLSTPQKMTDGMGQVVWEGEFKPFGEAVSIAGTVTNNLRFPGQYYDEESGLNYNYFRDYNPVIGRYVESDPIGIVMHLGIDRINHLYNYALLNPLKFRDSLGLKVCPPETVKSFSNLIYIVCIISNPAIDTAIIAGCAACAAGSVIGCIACALGTVAEINQIMQCREAATLCVPGCPRTGPPPLPDWYPGLKPGKQF